MRLIIASAAALAALTTAAAAEPKIAKIEAKLFLTRDGTLSDNVAAGSDVNLWNTVIGEGGAGPANDVLVIVTVAAEPNSYVDAPLVIEIAGADGKKVAERKIEGLLLGDAGTVSQAVYLQDSTCNALTVRATIGKSSATNEVPFACGE